MREDIAPVATAARTLDIVPWSAPETAHSFIMVDVPETDSFVHGLKTAGIKTIKHVHGLESSAKGAADADSGGRSTIFCVRFDGQGDKSVGHLQACRAHGHGAVVLAVLPPNATGQLALAALEAGADDFFYPSASAREVIARCTARTRVTGKLKDQIAIGDLTVDSVGRLIKASHGTRFLSPIDFRIIHILAAAEGNVVTREKIKSDCWKAEAVSDNAVNRKIHEVRRIISAISKQVGIRTVYGLGFALVNEGK